ncbi:hypothetical protein [Thiocapsa bogorovii]|uniref:hypothetical protein n=1 Tax=Thiocapsa bogorovii TaxID=521689 RepID=UPI001E5C9E0D|nr:hypothetical protein [Thiocapsa bogorovii]UHD15082.1 hypothetical protein LT988_17585 [Thiocapsa bogorovii]
MKNRFYMVDTNLGATRVDKILRHKQQLRIKEPLGATVPAAGDRPVLSGRQELKPNALYVSANNRLIRYYLPLYRLAVTDGKPEVELRYGVDEETEEVGRLTLSLAWTPPPAGRAYRVLAMDHSAVPFLRYQIPVERGGGAGEDTVPLQPLQQEGNGRATSVTIFTEKAQFDAVYQAMSRSDRDASLVIQIATRVGVRTWQQVVVGDTASKKAQVKVLERQGAFFTQTLSRESLATMRRTSTTTSRVRVTVRQPEPGEEADVNDLRRMLARPRQGARLSARNRTPPRMAQVASGATRRPSAATSPRRTGAPRPRVAVERTVSPSTVRLAAPVLMRARVAPTAPVARTTVAARAPSAARVTPMPTTRTSASTARTVTPRVAITSARVSATRPVFSSAALARVNAVALPLAVAKSDLKIAGRKAVPTKIALDTRGKPAIIDTDLENEQEIPFNFDPDVATNDEVFAITGYHRGGIHLLIPVPLFAASGRQLAVVYQDNLMRDLVYVAPMEFRLARYVEDPFLPGLTFLPGDFSTSAGESEAEVFYQVVMSYQLEPWIDPEVIELARAELAHQGLVARFSPILPREARLKLDLDILGDAQDRDEAEIEAAVGITDTLVLDHEAFVRLWRERLTKEAGVVRGQVSYRLFDGTEAHSGVAISLWQTSADVFDVDFIGPVEGSQGRYRVQLRNRIESPVVIADPPTREILADGVVAEAVNGAALAQRVVAPQEVVEVDYQVTPADAAFASLEPVVLGRVQPNPGSLLRLLMLTPGYGSLSFSVMVRAAGGTFGPPAEGAESLTGLMVEFDDGSEARLTPDQSEAEVNLVGRLIDQILGTADDQQRYFYRVTNLHPSGEGARTEWREGQGTDPLTVGTAVVKLGQFDF